MSTAYIFPGQGSQSVGMGGDWLGRSELVQRTFEEADEALGADRGDERDQDRRRGVESRLRGDR